MSEPKLKLSGEEQAGDRTVGRRCADPQIDGGGRK